jgi:dipeptidyl aminopeptidase/acylaminoacyl peptidase
MAKPKTLDVDTLWKIQRIGSPSLSPDGAQAVAAVTRYSMDDNSSASTLWLLSTLGGVPRALTQCGTKDGQPQWSPRGDRIAFIARRDQQGAKDDEPQLYLIAPDGGEAQRAATVATGVDAFRWLPDGRRIIFVSWVWPDARGEKAQARKLAAFKARKETGYATSETQYRYWDHNLPAGREPQLHLMELGNGDKPARVRNLFEGTPYSLQRTEPDSNCFDVSPDGTRVVFAFDPAAEKRIENRQALAELDLRTGRIDVILHDADWDFSAPRYSPDGDRVAFIARHDALKHTMPEHLAVWDRDSHTWDTVSAEWDHQVQAPLQWEDDGQAVLLMAEQEGRKHLWRFELQDRRAERVVSGGTLQAFDKRAGTLLTLADGIAHPARLTAHVPGEEPRRVEHFNDELLAGVATARTEEVWYRGARGDLVQMWLSYPPGFDAKKKHPILHLIHGGPHTAFGDAFHYRWNVQAMAAQGYVVACVNYHGSSSFGYGFLDSITHRWGELELQDVEAATDWLLKKPWADKRRVFATGGSYGGYMVAWMNGHVPTGRYAAYVCHAGCFDWKAMFADDAFSWHAKELGAYYWDDARQVDKQSPHAFAGTMNTPTLVIHGALDYRVPDAQGLAYYNTLKARGVDARLLWFPDENHWILKPRNSKQWYGEFFAWLARHDVKAPRR